MQYYVSKNGQINKWLHRKDGNMQYEEVKELIAIFEKTDLNDMELTLDNVSLRLNRGKAMPAAVGMTPAYNVPAVGMMQQGQITAPVQPGVPTEPSTDQQIKEEKKTESVAAQSQSAEGTIVKAPIVGTFYASSAPDKPAYVQAGDTVKEGDTLCIIEAMKFMNEVPSEVSGTVAEILVEDGEFVEYGQELFRIV